MSTALKIYLQRLKSSFNSLLSNVKLINRNGKNKVELGGYNATQIFTCLSLNAVLKHLFCKKECQYIMIPHSCFFSNNIIFCLFLPLISFFCFFFFPTTCQSPVSPGYEVCTEFSPYDAISNILFYDYQYEFEDVQELDQ